jgi:TonB family protein
MSVEERFAWGELNDYLDQVNHHKVVSQTPTKKECDFSKWTSLRARANYGSPMLSFPRPQYPPEAKERGAHGTVAVLLLVNVRSGLVEQACVSEGHEALHAAAKEAALRVKFSPYSRYVQENYSYAEERVVYGFLP